MTTETLPPNLASGQKLAGCYLLERPLDAGGGAIWLAEDEVLGKKVSLHFLPAAVSRDPGALEELRREIKRNRPLIHPGVLRVYDLVEGGDWTAVAMEAFEGRRLSALLADVERFEVDEVDPWLDQICVSLEEAHRIKLLHRDLSPENLFVTSTDRVLVANFGISRAVQTSVQKANPDQVGASHWCSLSPQMIEGATPTPSDDVYGVGALLHHLLAGHPMFEGGDLAEKIRRTVPPRLSDVREDAATRGAPIPPAWDNVIAACLNKASDERPQRPAEVVSSIEAYAAAVPAQPAAPIAPEAVETVVDAPVEAAAVLPTTLKLATPEPAAIEPPPAEPELEADEPVEQEEAVVVRAEAEPLQAESLLLQPLQVEAAPKIEEPELAAPEPAPVEGLPAAELEAAAVESASVFEAASPEPAVLESTTHEPAPPETQPGPKVEQKPASPQPVRYPDSEEDAFSKILPKRWRFGAAVAAAVILILVLMNGAFTGKEKETPVRSLTGTDSGEKSELTSVKNSVPETVAPKPPKPSEAVAAKATPAPEPAPKKPEPAMVVAAAKPTPQKTTTPIQVAPAPPATAVAAGPVDKNVAEKTAALERLKAELANFEKERQTRLKDQQTAAAAAAETQKAIDEKTKAAATAKKGLESLLASRKKFEDDQKTADVAAQAAQQMAAEKARAAEEAKKALADFEAKNREKLTGQEKSDAEIQALQRTLAEKQKAASDLAKANETADATRQKQEAAIKQGEQEIEQLKSSTAAMDNAKRQLDDDIAKMKAAFEKQMQDLADRRRQLESGSPIAPPMAPVAPAPTPVPPAPGPAPTGTKPTATATPAPVAPTPAPPLMAKVEPPKAPAATPAPPAAVATPAPSATGGIGAANSLGMRFAPVGEVQFCVWQARVKDFEAFAKAVGLKSTAWRGPGFRQGPDHPVVNVTWTEAVAFCKWLTDKEHKEGVLPASQFYRLPYDLEWSKAVGLPDETGRTPEMRDMGIPDVYPWGGDWPPPKGAGNYTGEETGSDVAIKGYDDGFAWTSPVGSFPPNKAGLYDMGGNVWQWCMDSWNNESKSKVLRGASWYNGALKLSLLSSCRIHATPDSSTDNYGFRIVRATETASAKSAKK